MLKLIRQLLELIRFSHTLFALPFALLSALMAWQLTPFRWRDLAGILVCMVAARSFAMAFNRLADRRLDADNPRTAGRHLPVGTLSVSQVTAFAALTSVGFLAGTLLFLPNPLPLILALPVLAVLAGYSYAKRFTSLAHFWLGTALALSPIAAWIAIRGEAVLGAPADLLPPLVLGGAVLAWVAGFDVIYACQDFAADMKAGLHSTPVVLGIPRALQVAATCHLAMIIFLVCLPWAYPLFGWLYWCGVVAIAALLIYEHRLVRPDDLTRINAAFFNVNAVVSVGLLAVGTLDLWIGAR